jgi:hypothetical protein
MFARQTSSRPPDWSQALIDDAERARRQREARRTLDNLKRSDPGGDVQL